MNGKSFEPGPRPDLGAESAAEEIRRESFGNPTVIEQAAAAAVAGVNGYPYMHGYGNPEVPAGPGEENGPWRDF